MILFCPIAIYQKLNHDEWVFGKVSDFIKLNLLMPQWVDIEAFVNRNHASLMLI